MTTAKELRTTGLAKSLRQNRLISDASVLCAEKGAARPDILREIDDALWAEINAYGFESGRRAWLVRLSVEARNDLMRAALHQPEASRYRGAEIAVAHDDKDAPRVTIFSRSRS